MKSPRFVFFGTPDIAVASLNHLTAAGFAPTLIVTAPDKPQGRHMELTPSDVKVWADAHNIPTLQPKTLKDNAVVEQLRAHNADLFIVVAYGKIIPQNVLDVPKHGTLNMHPSMLPRHRGPAPIESQILNEEHGENVGVSIMLLDADIDHGPVVIQWDHLSELEGRWPMKASELRPLLARYGGELLVQVVSNLDDSLSKAHEQDHDKATLCAKLTKEDALIDLTADPAMNYRKIFAYDIWPRAYCFVERHGKQMRVIITDAAIEEGRLILKKVIPEGKREMAYEEFQRGE
ncbi:MAG: methionyl-tRNA formyltransferase [Patescibacteria group bacterium]|jgi:methionyl-tRNA formyltransferase|nr:methionyl-tRNA formyltransferase [Patescibacteria group bacterium]